MRPNGAGFFSADPVEPPNYLFHWEVTFGILWAFVVQFAETVWGHVMYWRHNALRQSRWLMSRVRSKYQRAIAYVQEKWAPFILRAKRSLLILNSPLAFRPERFQGMWMSWLRASSSEACTNRSKPTGKQVVVPIPEKGDHANLEGDAEGKRRFGYDECLKATCQHFKIGSVVSADTEKLRSLATEKKLTTGFCALEALEMAAFYTKPYLAWVIGASLLSGKQDVETSQVEAPKWLVSQSEVYRTNLSAKLSELRRGPASQKEERAPDLCNVHLVDKGHAVLDLSSMRIPAFRVMQLVEIWDILDPTGVACLNIDSVFFLVRSAFDPNTLHTNVKGSKIDPKVVLDCIDHLDSSLQDGMVHFETFVRALAAATAHLSDENFVDLSNRVYQVACSMLNGLSKRALWSQTDHLLHMCYDQLHSVTMFAQSRHVSADFNLPIFRHFLHHKSHPMTEHESRVVSQWVLARWMKLVNPPTTASCPLSPCRIAVQNRTKTHRRKRIQQWKQNAERLTKVLDVMGSLVYQSSGLWTHAYPRGWEGVYQDENGNRTFHVMLRIIQVVVTLCTGFGGLVVCGVIAMQISHAGVAANTAMRIELPVAIDATQAVATVFFFLFVNVLVGVLRWLHWSLQGKCNALKIAVLLARNPAPPDDPWLDLHLNFARLKTAEASFKVRHARVSNVLVHLDTSFLGPNCWADRIGELKKVRCRKYVKVAAAQSRYDASYHRCVSELVDKWKCYEKTQSVIKLEIKTRGVGHRLRQQAHVRVECVLKAWRRSAVRTKLIIILDMVRWKRSSVVSTTGDKEACLVDEEVVDSKFKTVLCPQWEQLGECELGDECLYAHGKGELRTREEISNQNAEVGLKDETGQTEWRVHVTHRTHGPRTELKDIGHPEVESTLSRMAVAEVKTGDQDSVTGETPAVQQHADPQAWWTLSALWWLGTLHVYHHLCWDPPASKVVCNKLGISEEATGLFEDVDRQIMSKFVRRLGVRFVSGVFGPDGLGQSRIICAEAAHFVLKTCWVSMLILGGIEVLIVCLRDLLSGRLGNSPWLHSEIIGAWGAKQLVLQTMASLALFYAVAVPMLSLLGAGLGRAASHSLRQVISELEGEIIEKTDLPLDCSFGTEEATMATKGGEEEGHKGPNVVPPTVLDDEGGGSEVDHVGKEKTPKVVADKKSPSEPPFPPLSPAPQNALRLAPLKNAPLLLAKGAGLQSKQAMPPTFPLTTKMVKLERTVLAEQHNIARISKKMELLQSAQKNRKDVLKVLEKSVGPLNSFILENKSVGFVDADGENLEAIPAKDRATFEEIVASVDQLDASARRVVNRQNKLEKQTIVLNDDLSKFKKHFQEPQSEEQRKRQAQLLNKPELGITKSNGRTLSSPMKKAPKKKSPVNKIARTPVLDKVASSCDYPVISPEYHIPNALDGTSIGYFAESRIGSDAYRSMSALLDGPENSGGYDSKESTRRL
jgi:hypothetical protein